MKIEVNVRKKYFFVIAGLVLLLSGVLAVYAYTTGFDGAIAPTYKTAPDAKVLGHSADEVAVRNSDGTLFTVQELLANGIGSEANSLVYSSEINCLGTTSSDKNCTIGSASEWDACFLTRVETIQGSGAFDDGCYVEKTSSEWKIFLNQDGGEILSCSARCVKGGGTADSFVPSGGIMIFDGSCPTGWTRFTKLDGKFPLGGDISGSAGGLLSSTGKTGPPTTTIDVKSGTDVAVADTAHAHTVPYYTIVYCKKD